MAVFAVLMPTPQSGLIATIQRAFVPKRVFARYRYAMANFHYRNGSGADCEAWNL